MRAVILTRNTPTSDGTFGKFILDDGATFCSGELPWRDNASGTSCIPVGVYTCHWINSPKHGWCYQVMDVPERSMIEIHSANFMGDASCGKLCQLLGCIALGKSTGMLESQMAVLASKEAIAEFEANMKQEDFQLTIEWAK